MTMFEFAASLLNTNGIDGWFFGHILIREDNGVRLTASYSGQFIAGFHVIRRGAVVCSIDSEDVTDLCDAMPTAEGADVLRAAYRMARTSFDAAVAA